MKIIFIFFSILFFYNYAKSQGNIGQTEQMIRAEYSGKPNMEISVEYIKGRRTIIAQDYDAIMSFGIDDKTKLCIMSMMQIKNNKLLQKLIPFFDQNYNIITKGAAWTASLKGHLIKIELRYSSKLSSNIILWYLPNN